MVEIDSVLRIVHVSTDDISGGAARCAHRLHRGLREIGQDSRMLVGRRRSGEPEVVSFHPPAESWIRLRRRLLRWRVNRDFGRYRRTRPAGFGPFTNDRCPRGLGLVKRLPPRDVVHLHWVAGLVDYRDFFAHLPDDVPVVWTLHDMNLLTGGCHCDHGCGRFTERCGACPQLGSNREDDLSRRVLLRKREVLSRVPDGRLHIVTPSRWLAGEARRSSVLGGRFPVTVIPYGLDTEDFAVRDRSTARRVLGIPLEARVILFVAHDVTNRSKGFADLVEMLRELSSYSDLFLLSVGNKGSQLDSGVPHRHLAYTGDDRLLSLVYSAADVFVTPTHQDNLPATVLESLACGTPVVAFETGGVPELVRPGETGALAPLGDVGGLRDRTVELLGVLADEARRRELSETCRTVAVEEYSLGLQARRYVELYRGMLGQLRASPPERRDGPIDAKDGQARVERAV